MSKQFEFLKSLPSYATRHFSSEEEDLFRSKFDRDRDRVLFSKEFRRLEGKTQVFVNGFDDHIRNRLTHTLEVSQIAQSISKYFGFNLTLSEAIALAHDVGHTPFGHIGERVLNYFTNNCDPYKDFKIEKIIDQGFKHNWQGLRVLCSLERINPLYKGLNLTDYTLWGVLHHSSKKYKKCKLNNADNICTYRQCGNDCHIKDQEFLLNFYNGYSDYYTDTSWSFEALIVSCADEIAQRHHDIEDGLIAGIIDIGELIAVFKDFFEDYLSKEQKLKLTKLSKTDNKGYVLHDLSSFILSFYSLNLISNSEIMIKDLINKYGIKNDIDFYRSKSTIHNMEDLFKLISYEGSFEEKDKQFQDYLVNRILNSHLAQSMDGKASYILKNLIEAFLTNPKQLPDNTIIFLMANYLTNSEFRDMIKDRSEKHYVGIMRKEVDVLHKNNDPLFTTQLIRTITDFIAGMTDKFALTQYRILYGSDNYWSN